MGLREILGRHPCASPKEAEAEAEVGQPTGGDPQQGDEDGEDEHGKTDVVLGPEDHDGESPSEDDREEWSGVEHESVAQTG